MWWALAFAAVAFGAFLVSFYDGRSKAEKIGGLKDENKGLRREIISLEAEIAALRAPAPTRDQAGRVLDKAVDAAS